MTEPLIRIEGVTKRFPGTARPALDAISAAIAPGRITGLVGPDGAGKTTLIRLMTGLLLPDAGTIRITGFDTVTEAARIHAVTGYMPQRFGLYEDLTVAENLDLYADLRGVVGPERRAAVRRLLDFTDLARFTGRLAGKLSGGMKQKLGLACALVRTPRVLLLDEPSVGVDPISRRELWRMVKGLLADGLAVVWSTSYLDEAELCEEVLLLSEGRLLFAGRPAELTRQVVGRTFLLRGVAADRRSVLARALGRPDVIDGVVQGRSVRLVLTSGAMAPDPHELAGHDTARLDPVSPRFEDAFVDRLGGGPGGRSALAERMPPVARSAGPVVEARGLTKRFGDFTAAERVSFSIPAGEIFGLLGPNGAGKSTTFRMLCGLLQPTEGKALVVGLDLKTSASAARARLGYMAQKFSLYGNLTVGQNLRFFAGAYGLTGARRQRKVEEMVETFGLAPQLGHSADSLPLGLKQRLALACAVMHEPAVLFLDEPTSGVDPITRREFWTHINGMVGKGVTVLVTTHFMDEAEYCDRIGLIFRGRKIAEGSPDELKACVRTAAMPDPTLEDAFIALVEASEAPQARAA